MRNIIIKDPQFFQLLACAQEGFISAGYTEEDIENAVKKVREKK